MVITRNTFETINHLLPLYTLDFNIVNTILETNINRRKRIIVHVCDYISS